MNGIDLTCSVEGGPIIFEGFWGDWDPTMRKCIGGFSGASIKLESQQVTTSRSD